MLITIWGVSAPLQGAVRDISRAGEAEHGATLPCPVPDTGARPRKSREALSRRLGFDDRFETAPDHPHAIKRHLAYVAAHQFLQFLHRKVHSGIGRLLVGPGNPGKHDGFIILQFHKNVEIFLNVHLMSHLL